MANIFRGPTQVHTLKKAFVNTDVVPNILLGLAALLTPLGNQPFHQHDWPVPARAKANLQDFQLAGYTTRNIPPTPPFPPAEWTYQLPYYSRIRPAQIESSNFVAPFFRPVVSTPFIPYDFPTPQKARPAVIETNHFVAPFFRMAVNAPFSLPDLPVPVRARPVPYDSTLSIPHALQVSVPLQQVERLPLHTQIQARKQPISPYSDQGKTPIVLLSAFVQISPQSVHATAEDQGLIASAHSRGFVFNGPPSQPLPPLVSPEYTVGTHQKDIAEQNPRGSVWGRPSSLFTVAALVVENFEIPESRVDPVFAWIRSPHVSVLVAHAPPLGQALTLSQEYIQAVDVNPSKTWGPTPPTGGQAISNDWYADQEYPEYRASFIVLQPEPPGGGQTIQYEWYADQDWPEYRPSSIETTYTALFPSRQAPLFRPAVIGAPLDTEQLQPNASEIAGQTPATGVAVSLGPLPQVSPQQYDQGYGLVDTFGWSRFPPLSIAPDVVPNRPIPQAAPSQLDYLQSSESGVSGPQPFTAGTAPINRTAWTDPEQKTIASQQAYGALFGARKPPNFFINVKMVPGQDVFDGLSGSVGHGKIVSIAPPPPNPTYITFEFQIGTHQRNVADAHSRGWVSPRIPPSGLAVPLGPADFTAPEQYDIGRAIVFGQPPPSAQNPQLTPFIYAQRQENLESETLITTEPKIAPPTAPALGPAIFSAQQQSTEQPQPFLDLPQLSSPPGPAFQTVYEFQIGTHQRNIADSHSRGWVSPKPPFAGGKAYLSAEFYAAQDSTEQPFTRIFGPGLSVVPPALVVNFVAGSQEFIDSSFVWISFGSPFDVPLPPVPPITFGLFVPQEVPDQGNAGAAALSKPFLPLPTAALGPIVFAAPEHRDQADTSGIFYNVSGAIPPSGGNPPITISLFSAPDQRNQADEPSGGNIHVVWQRHVPTALSAPHMLPLGFALMRLGGIQMQ